MAATREHDRAIRTFYFLESKRRRHTSVDIAGGLAAEVEEVVFSGAATRLLLRAVAAPEQKLDLRLASDAGGQVPQIGQRVSIIYDPADAVVVPA